MALPRVGRGVTTLIGGELRKLLSGHLCRCTGYENTFRAVKKTMYRRQGRLDMSGEIRRVDVGEKGA